MAKQPVSPDSKSLDEQTEAELKRGAKARLRRLNPTAKAAVIGDALGAPVTGPLAGFVTFIRERAVVGLAIGFVIGTQVQAVVKQFITSFVDPLFALIIPGNKALSDQVWKVQISSHQATFAWGALAYVLLDFFFVVFAIYMVIHLLKLDKLDKKQ